MTCSCLKLIHVFVPFLLILLHIIEPIHSKVVTFQLEAYYFPASPDGVQKQVLVVNGQFPGPTIRANINDTLIIRVTNSIRDKDSQTFPTSVHWHGIEMFLNPWYDGPEGVTQCPIAYGQSMDYKFKLDRSGTYW